MISSPSVSYMILDSVKLSPISIKYCELNGYAAPITSIALAIRLSISEPSSRINNSSSVTESLSASVPITIVSKSAIELTSLYADRLKPVESAT